MSGPRHEIVVSAENSPYLGWQAMLFHFSCLKHLGRPPVVMVHGDEGPLVPEFERIRRSGGIVQRAQNYRRVHGVDYSPRNTAGSLRHVRTDAESIVLCDPDMFFVRPLPVDELVPGGRQVTFDRVGYLDPDIAEYQPALDDVCRRAGVAPGRLRHPVVNGGVPHVIHSALREPLSREWLDVIELFPTRCTPDSPEPRKDWLATMWALVIALHRLELEPVMTSLCATNCHEDRPLDSAGPPSPTLVHYCYGGPAFNKRVYTTAEDAASTVWNLAPDDGSIAGTIREHLREAGRFYGLQNS